MLRAILTAIFTMTALPAIATCSGESFLDRLTDAELADLTAAVDATPYPRGLIWTATKGGQTLNVVGTMHIHDPRLDPLFAQIAPMVATADLLLVEATAAEEAEMQTALAENPDMIFITEGPTLIEQLDEDRWKSLSEAASARSIPPFMAAKMQPWYLALSLAIPTCALPDLMSGKRGLDHMIMAEAEANGIPMQAVEPWTTLLDVMRNGTAEEQLEMLQVSIFAPELQDEMYVTMLDSYFQQDVSVLWEASRIATNYVPGLDPVRGAELFAETEQLILIDRNVAWMPVIAEAIEGKENVMLAVGAAHLPGDQGVLNLLAKDGWEISSRQ